MAGALENLQMTAGQLRPAVPAALGFICVWLGLCIWLGGLRWLKAVSAFAAVSAGFAAAWFLTDRSLMPLLLLPLFAGVLAVFIDKPAAVLLAAVQVVIIVLSILAAPALAGPQLWENPPTVQLPQGAASLSIPESLHLLARQTAFFASGFYQAFLGLKSLFWVACAVIVLAVAGIGLLWPRGVCALACAVLGTAGLYLGMFFLLVFKGSKPVDYLLSRPALFALVALGMITLGTLASLVFCPARSKSSTKTTAKEIE